VGSLVAQSAGAGARVTGSVTGEASHAGVVSLDAGTTATGRSALNSGITAILLGQGRARFGVWYKTDSTLSDGTNRYEVFAGFLDDITGTPVDAVYFHYRDDINAGKWECKTLSNSVATTLDSAITVATSTWYFLEAEVNAAGTSVTFYINKSSVGSITTNIPIVAGRETGFALGIVKSLGTTNRVVNLDSYYLEMDYTTLR
jgi:hypothetical protein